MSISSKIELRQDESIAFTVRPSHLNCFWSYLLALIIIFGASFFAFWLILQNWYGIAVLVSSGLASLALIFRARSKINSNYWVLTNKRLVDVEKHGFFKDTISNVEFNQITDVHVKRGGLRSLLFGLGDLVIDAGNEDYAISINGIKDPQVILDSIMKLADNADYNRFLNDSKSVIKNLFKILPTLTIEEIQEIINRLKNRLIEYQEDDE